MRDRIARTLVWVLHIVLPARGRHRAPEPSPAVFVICAPRTPIPPHVLARTVPVRWPVRVPPYLREWIDAQEAEWERQRQRRVSAAAAALGYDVPFAFDGTDVARVGMSA
jgi:hypothetical protein